jgi:hypothetical protein
MERRDINMKRYWRLIGLIGVLVVCSSLVFANPAMLPQHPGYPMDEAKSPVTGQPLANDPGRTVPTVEEARVQAAEFDNSQVLHPQKEKRPNIIHGQLEPQAEK